MRQKKKSENISNEAYIFLYQQKYGKLDKEGKKYILRMKKEAEKISNEEIEKTLLELFPKESKSSILIDSKEGLDEHLD